LVILETSVAPRGHKGAKKMCTDSTQCTRCGF